MNEVEHGRAYGLRLEQRLLQAAEDLLAHRGRRVMSVAFPGADPPLFIVVGWLIRRFELRGALLAIPLASLLSFLALAALPILLVLTVLCRVGSGRNVGFALATAYAAILPPRSASSVSARRYSCG